MEHSSEDRAEIEFAAQDMEKFSQLEEYEIQIREAEQELAEMRASPLDMDEEIQCLERHLARIRYEVKLIKEAEQDMYAEVDELKGELNRKPFIERLNTGAEGAELTEIECTANKFKKMRERYSVEQDLPERYNQWLELIENGKTPNESEVLRLQFEINVLGAFVAEAQEAEAELKADMESLGKDEPQSED